MHRSNVCENVLLLDWAWNQMCMPGVDEGLGCFVHTLGLHKFFQPSRQKSSRVPVLRFIFGA